MPDLPDYKALYEAEKACRIALESRLEFAENGLRKFSEALRSIEAPLQELTRLYDASQKVDKADGA